MYIYIHTCISISFEASNFPVVRRKSGSHFGDEQSPFVLSPSKNFAPVSCNRRRIYPDKPSEKTAAIPCQFMEIIFSPIAVSEPGRLFTGNISKFVEYFPFSIEKNTIE